MASCSLSLSSLQGFRNELGKLEKPESLTPKIAEKNARCREIQHEINRLAQQQRELGAEKQQYEDQIRSRSCLIPRPLSFNYVALVSFPGQFYGCPTPYTCGTLSCQQS